MFFGCRKNILGESKQHLDKVIVVDGNQDVVESHIQLTKIIGGVKTTSALIYILVV